MPFFHMVQYKYEEKNLFYCASERSKYFITLRGGGGISFVQTAEIKGMRKSSRHTSLHKDSSSMEMYWDN